jgi:hypothetical protein
VIKKVIEMARVGCVILLFFLPAFLWIVGLMLLVKIAVARLGVLFILANLFVWFSIFPIIPILIYSQF